LPLGRLFSCRERSGISAGVAYLMAAPRMAIIANRPSRGTMSRKSSSRLPARSVYCRDMPVTLPPGRARVATRPLPNGSAAVLLLVRESDCSLPSPIDIRPGGFALLRIQVYSSRMRWLTADAFVSLPWSMTSPGNAWHWSPIRRCQAHGSCVNSMRSSQSVDGQ
jgi:hypothetical protein